VVVVKEDVDVFCCCGVDPSATGNVGRAESIIS